MVGRSRRGPAGRRATALFGVLAIAATAVVAAGPSVDAAPPPLVRSWGQVPQQISDLDEPHGVAVGPDGLMYVADRAAESVLVFDQDGTFQRDWSTTAPVDLAVDPTSGHVLTMESTTCAIRVTTPTGAFVRHLGSWCGGLGGDGLGAPAALAVAPDGTVSVADYSHAEIQQYAPTGEFLRRWGASGSGDGKLFRPTAVAVGADGTIFVGDAQRDDVQAFTPTGTFLYKWGSAGSGPGQFANISGIAVAPDGSVVVTDTGATGVPLSVQHFAADGTFLARWGTAGTYPGRLGVPQGVAVAPDGSVFVADSHADNRRVQRYSSAGDQITAWGTYTVPTRMRAPAGATTTPDGRVVVADRLQDRVQVFTDEGVLVDTWTEADNADGHLENPWGVAARSDGGVLVVDRGHRRIQRYLADGTPDGGWGSQGTGDGQFQDPMGIAIAADGDVYVSDVAARRIQQFTASGTFVRAWPTVTAVTGTTFAPGGLDLDDDGSVYVVNTSHGHVEVFDPDGTAVRRWSVPGAPTGLTVDRAHDAVYTTHCSASSNLVRRTDPSGQAVTSIPITSCPRDVAVDGTDLYVSQEAQATAFIPESRVEQHRYPPGPVVDITLTAAATSGVAGTPLQYHVTLANNGGTPLTGVSTTSAQLDDCARPVADLPLRATVRFECTYTPTAADAGAFTATVAVDSDQTDPVISEPVSVQVNGAPTAVHVREWRPSPSGLADTDPIGGTTASSAPGLDVDADGNVYAAGRRAYPEAAQVQRFGPDGRFEAAFGEPGSAPGQLGRPNRVGVGPSGEVYVADCDNARLQRFSANGTFQQSWTEERTAASRNACSPADVAVAASGTAYVADAANDRIATIMGDDLTPGWGTTGTGNGEFNTPNGVAVGPDGTVYVLDGGNRRVQRFSPDGTYQGQWGSEGTALGQFRAPTAIDVDENGVVYVAEAASTGSTGRRVQVFTPTGEVIVALPIVTPELAVHVDPGGSTRLFTYPYRSGTVLEAVVREYVLAAGPVVAATLTSGGGCVATSSPSRTCQIPVGSTIGFSLRIDNLGTVPLTGVTVDAGGLTGCTTAVPDIAVGAHRTVTCTSSTATLAHVGRHHLRTTVSTNQTPATRSNTVGLQVLRPTIGQFGSAGPGQDQFRNPRGMIANWQGDLYIADCDNDRVVRRSSGGEVLAMIGSGGDPGPGHLRCPTDVALAGNGNVLVLNQGHHNVHEFQPDGTFVRWWDLPTTDPGLPWAIDVDDAGTIYVADAESERVEYEELHGICCIDVTYPPAGNNLVRRFTSDGTFLDQWGGYPGRHELRGMWITGAGDLHLVNKARVDVNTVDGTVRGTLASPGASVRDVAVDRFGHVWVAGTNHVREFTPGGNLLAEYTMRDVTGITVDRDNVYVSNRNRVTKLGVGPALSAVSGRLGSATTTSGMYVVALRAADLAFVRGTIADAVGDYRLAVPPGEYLLQFYSPTGQHRFEWYKNRPAPNNLAEIERVVVTEGNETIADTIIPVATGSIHGTMRRDGAPNSRLSGIYAVALRNGVPAGMAVSSTLGDYRISGLAPGTYTVVFVDPTRTYAPEVHLNVADPAQATPVVVTASPPGTSLGVTSLAVTSPPTDPVGVVTGTVAADGTGQPVQGALVVALGASDLSLSQATRTADDGTYSLPLPTGGHYLQIADPTGRHRFEWYDDQPTPASFAALTQVAAGATADASVAPTQGTIAGTVGTTGSGTPIGGAWVIAFGAGGSFGTVTADDGSYSIHHLAPGSYTVVFVDPTAGHRAEYHADSQTPGGATPVSVDAATTATIDAGLDPT